MTMISATRPARCRRPCRPRRAASQARPTRLTAAKAEARKPMNVSPIWDDRQEAARLVEQALHAARAAVALLDELVDAAAAHRDEGDLGRDEERLEQRSGGR